MRSVRLPDEPKRMVNVICRVPSGISVVSVTVRAMPDSVDPLTEYVSTYSVCLLALIVTEISVSFAAVVGAVSAGRIFGGAIN